MPGGLSRSDPVIPEAPGHMINTGAAELRQALRDVYRAAAGRDHPDWDEYDEAMVRDRRAAVVVVPDHVYGTAV